MAETTVPTWFKWAAGLTLAAAGVAGLVLAKDALDLKDPWAADTKPPPEPEAFVVDVMQGDEDDDDWYVTITLYDGVDKHGDEYNGHVGDAELFDDRDDAVKRARELGKAARQSGNFKLVRVIATKKDWKAADKRRRVRKNREALQWGGAAAES